MRVVCRIVQHLDLEQMGWIVDLAGSFEKAVHYVALVVDRELNGYPRKLLKWLRRGRIEQLLPVFPIPANHLIAVQPVARKNDENGEVRNQDRVIEEHQPMDPGKRVVPKGINDLIRYRRRAARQQKCRF